MMLSMLAVLCRPVAYEFSLLFSFDFKLDVRCLDVCWNLNKNLSSDNISRLVEWELSLKLNLSIRKDAAWISEVKHKIIINILTN